MSIENLQAALFKRGFETVECDQKTKQVRLMGRVDKNPNVQNNWLLVVQQLNFHSARSGWKADVSKLYFNDDANRVRYAWRILLQGEDVSKHYAEIAGIVLKAPKSNRVEVTEMILPGGANRNSKGNVGPAGTVRVGPDAVRRG